MTIRLRPDPRPSSNGHAIRLEVSHLNHRVRVATGFYVVALSEWNAKKHEPREANTRLAVLAIKRRAETEHARQVAAGEAPDVEKIIYAALNRQPSGLFWPWALHQASTGRQAETTRQKYGVVANIATKW